MTTDRLRQRLSCWSIPFLGGKSSQKRADVSRRGSNEGRGTPERIQLRRYWRSIKSGLHPRARQPGQDSRGASAICGMRFQEEQPSVRERPRFPHVAGTEVLLAGGWRHSREYLTDIGPDLVARRLAERPRYVFKDPSVKDDARRNALASLERIHARARDHTGSNRSIETPELAIALSARGRIGFRHESGLAASASLLDHDTQVTSGPGLTSSCAPFSR
jgi:hypothetical protein